MQSIENNNLVLNLVIQEATSKDAIETWDSTKYYKAGSVVIYNNKIYKAISDAPAGTIPETYANWTEVKSFYIKLNNGLIIQWGFEPTGSQQRVVNQKITFPIAFSNTNYSLTVTPNTWQSDTIHRIGWIGSNKLSETQAWLNFYGNGNQDTIDGMNWLAIGF